MIEFYWKEVESIIRVVANSIKLQTVNIDFIKECLDHNELGLALELCLDKIVENNIALDKTLNNNILMAYYQMDCLPEILKKYLHYNQIPDNFPKQIDGGLIVAMCKPEEIVVEHFKTEFKENLNTIVAVKYKDGYNEFFCNDSNESITDNFYTNAVEMNNMKHIYSNKTITFNYNWLLNAYND